MTVVKIVLQRGWVSAITIVKMNMDLGSAEEESILKIICYSETAFTSLTCGALMRNLYCTS